MRCRKAITGYIIKQDGYAETDNVAFHRTAVAGIAATEDNSFAVVGIARGVRLWEVKVLYSSGTGSISTMYIDGSVGGV